MQTLEQSQTRTNTASAPPAPDASPRSLRVAFLLSQYPAVSHTFLLNEVLGLRARGLAVETASINPPDRPLDKLSTVEATESASTQYIKSGSKLVALMAVLGTALTEPLVVLRGLTAVFQLPGLTLRKRALWLFYLAEAILVGRWMRARGLRHLHVHFGGPVASVGYLTSIAWQLPYSLTIHGPEELLNTDAYQLPAKLARAAFVLCISDFCRSQLCQLTPAAQWDKFTVIRLGVDPVLLTPHHPRHEPDPGAPVRLVCTGRLVAAKGHHTLLRALAVLRARNVNLSATLIGDGPERASLEAYVCDHGLQDSVTFTSSLSHATVLHHVRSADIFCLASFAEGVPVALMEAMAFAVPCVSTTIAGIPELIRSGQDGLLVPPSNVTALADALESLANDPGLRSYLGGAARQRIIRDYNLPLNHERLAQYFQGQLAEGVPA